MKETSYNKKGTSNYRKLDVANILVHLIQCWVRWFSFHINTINSNNTNRKISMINEKINKSFLNILSPPFFWSLAITQLLNVPIKIISNSFIYHKYILYKNIFVFYIWKEVIQTSINLIIQLIKNNIPNTAVSIQ